MNDRFRFRVWDFLRKCMLYKSVINKDWLYKPDKSVDLVKIAYACASYSEYQHSDLMQCTGLKDKNGTLIYEGDIVSGNGWAKDRAIEVTFDEARFKPNTLISNPAFCVEVIGNIYENPELLEK